MIYEINDYPQYITYLQRILHANGGMSDQEINAFLIRNDLTKRFDITSIDVKKDLQMLSSGMNTGSIMTIQGGRAGKARGVEVYEFLIKEWSKNPYKLSVKKMEDLIKSNKLSKYGITVADVAADIRDRIAGGGSNNSVPKKTSSKKTSQHTQSPTTIVKKTITTINEYEAILLKYVGKHGDRAYLDVNIEMLNKEYGLSQISKTYIDDVRMDCILIKSKQKPSSTLAKSFGEIKKTSVDEQNIRFAKELESITLKYKEKLDNRQIFKGILWDCFPNNKMEIGLIVHLLEYDIVYDLSKMDTVDALTINKYSNRLFNDYGVDIDIAHNITAIWCSICAKL